MSDAVKSKEQSQPTDKEQLAALNARAAQLTLELFPYPVANYEAVVNGVQTLSGLPTSTMGKIDAIVDLQSDCAWMLTCQQLSDIHKMESELQEAISNYFGVHHRLIQKIQQVMNSTPECQPSKRARLLHDLRTDIQSVSQCNVLLQLPEARAVRSKASDLALAQRELHVVHQQIANVTSNLS
jgi:hypothetical protein